MIDETMLAPPKKLSAYMYECCECKKETVAGYFNFYFNRCSKCAVPFIIEKLRVQAVASTKVREALSEGVLERQNSCELCSWDSTKIVAHHHRGYDHPLDVWWICTSCNLLLSGPEYHAGIVSKSEATTIIAAKLRISLEEYKDKWTRKMDRQRAAGISKL